MGLGEGKPEWGWGSGREDTAPGRPGELSFPFPGPGLRPGLSPGRDRPFPLLRAAGNKQDFLLCFHLFPSLMAQTVTTRLSWERELWRGARLDLPCATLFWAGDSSLSSLVTVSKVSSCHAESLPRSLCKGKVLTFYL